MNRSTTRIAVFALLTCAAAATPALAASSASSAASDSVATSVGSISDSLKKSSNSSSNAVVADGDYTVIDVALILNRPDRVRLTLRANARPPAGAAAAAAPDDDFFLDLPLQLAERLRLASGQTIAARQRPYGVEFATGTPRRAFFLALADDWYRELQARPLPL